MEKEEVKRALLELIGDELPEIGADIDFSKDISAEYGVNSVSIIKLIVAAESQFDITFSDYELALDEYETFGDLAAVIKDKLDKKED